MLGSSYRTAKPKKTKTVDFVHQNGRRSAILNQILTKLELTGKGTILYHSTEYEGPSSCSGQVIARRSPKNRKQSILVHQNGRRSAILNPILTKLELTGKGTILYQSTEYEGPTSCSGQVIVRRSPKKQKTVDFGQSKWPPVGHIGSDFDQIRTDWKGSHIIPVYQV